MSKVRSPRLSGCFALCTNMARWAYDCAQLLLIQFAQGGLVPDDKNSYLGCFWTEAEALEAVDRFKATGYVPMRKAPKGYYKDGNVISIHLGNKYLGRADTEPEAQKLVRMLLANPFEQAVV